MINHLEESKNCLSLYGKSRQEMNKKYEIVEIIGGNPIIQIENGFYTDARFSGYNIYKQLEKFKCNKNNKYFITTKQIGASPVD